MNRPSTTRDFPAGAPETPRLRTLGTTALLAHGRLGAPILDLQPKRLALLVFLADASRAGPIRRDVLLARFWPDSDDAHARGVLRQALSSIRKQLGPDAILALGEEDVALAPGALTCDVTDLEAACESGSFESALQLYAGEFMAGFHASDVAPEFEQWVDAERARLRRLAGDAGRRAATLAEQTGQPSMALRWCWRAVEIEPDNEAAVARLIRVLDAQGDRAGALRVYQELERRLAAEFAAEPAPETRALIRTIRARPTPVAGELSLLFPAPVDGQVAPAPMPVPITSATGPARRPLYAALATLAATGIIALTVSSTGARAVPSAGRSLVAATPFRFTTSDSSLQWLAVALPELLASRLSTALPARLLTPDAARPTAALRVLHGSVAGTRAELALTAWLSHVGGGDMGDQVTSRGPVDSLGRVLDDLAWQLLALESGLDAQQVGALEDVPPAARAPFLEGRAQLRAGRADVAVQHFAEALAADSTFAEAALEIARLGAWPGSEIDERPALATAHAHRARLTRSDQVVLDMLLGNWSSAPERLGALNAAVAALPQRGEMWYHLGDGWLHFGTLAGFPDALARAEEAFRRGWVADSAAHGFVPLASPLLAEPAMHLVELAHIRGDTAEVLRLADLIARADSGSDLAATAGWHAAVMRGKAARAAWWGRSRDLSQHTTKSIVIFISSTGLAGDDLARAWEEDSRRLLAYDPGFRGWAMYLWALNAGRPGDLPAYADYPAARATRWQQEVRAATWWGLDPLAGEAAGRGLAGIADGPPRQGTAGVEQDHAACTMATIPGRGNARGALRVASQLRDGRLSGLTGPDSATHQAYRALCAALIDARHAVAQGAPDARQVVAVADSLARVAVGAIALRASAISDANLLLASWWEELGEPGLALAAIRRRPARFLRGPILLSTHLREEGRLAAATGDTAGAIRAWRHYLLLRPNPEPRAAAEADSIRLALASLTTR